MTPEPKKPMEGKLLEDDELKKVSGGIRFHDPIRDEDIGSDTDVPGTDESDENSGKSGGIVFVKPVYDPDEI